MSPSAPHLLVVPIVLPLVTAAVLALLGERRPRARSLVNVGATIAGLVVAVQVLRRVDAGGAASIGVYLAGNWEAPFGIVLVADRLAALMLVLVGVVSVCAAVYAEARWARASSYLHPLFQIQLMGLNGAFLTGDLFNLFVFFEVMLAASYGLQLHGSGWPRVNSGLHYIAVNLLASSLFLVGLAMIYGVMGTLSMADIAAKFAGIRPGDRGLLNAGAAILAVAFLVKAAIWPLNGWLVPAYSAASAPVAAIFALMTKVGIYVLIRLWTLLFSSGSPSADFAAIGGSVLFYGGLVTIAFGAVGVLSTMRLGRLAGFSVIVSSGTLLAALGMGEASVTGAALFYLLSATLSASALFLLIELVERFRTNEKSVRADIDVDVQPDEDTNLDDEQAPLVGRTLPLSIAALGLAFMCCTLLVAGLPPLSGFIAKVALLSSALGLGENAPVSPPAGWWLLGLLLFSGLTAAVSLSRAGVRQFWTAGGRPGTRVELVEAGPVLALLCCCALLTVFAEPVLRYTTATAAGLHAPRDYIDAVMSTSPQPGPTRPNVQREATP